jgi:Tfp pilus assembly protein PilO
MSFLRSNKILIAVVAAAAAAAAFWFLALAPKRKEAADLQAKTATQRANAEQARQQLAGYQKARASYKANYAILARLGKAVPADDDIRSLLVQLDGAAGGMHVDFQKLDVGSGSATSSSSSSGSSTTTSDGLAPPPGTVPVGTSGISAEPFNLTFNGTYFNLTGFFRHLDRFVAVHNKNVRSTGRLLRVETISLSPSNRGWPTMSAQVSAATYLVAPDGAAGATPAAGTPAATTGGQSTPTSGTSTPATPSTPTTPTTATVTGAAR